MTYDFGNTEVEIANYNLAYNDNTNAAAPNATNDDGNNIHATNIMHAGIINPHATQHAPPKRNKIETMNVLSQNVRGQTRGHSSKSCLAELLHGMLTQRCQIALLQDTQQGYPCATDEDLDPRLAIHAPPGEFQIFHGLDAPLPTHPDGSRLPPDPTSLWPFGAVWSDSDRSANSVLGSAGVAIIMGKKASDAHLKAVELLGHNKAILNISPRLLAVRLIFVDARGKQVQFLVASAYAPPYSTTTKYAEQIAAFYSNMDTLMEALTDEDILIIGGDLNAHIGSNRPIRRRAITQCSAIGNQGMKEPARS